LHELRATTVTSSDGIVRGVSVPPWKPIGLMMGLATGFGKPRNPVLGMVAAGEVDAVGPHPGRFEKGQRVVAYTVLSPTKTRFGTCAQYICIPEDWIVVETPASLSHEEAAVIPYPAELAMYFLKKGNIRNRKEALVVGASGSIGPTAVHLARHFGARAAGEFRPVIDRSYPLEDMVEAHRYVEPGRKNGGVVITMDHGS
jgi:NADPH:quinone reductase-like Zn-dependent oxidoreductase